MNISERLQYVMEKINQRMKAGELVELIPSSDESRYKEPAVLWSDVIFEVERNPDFDGVIDPEDEDLVMEIFCDYDYCLRFMGRFHDLIHEAEAWNCPVTFDELNFVSAPDWMSPVRCPDYVITITPDWHVAVEQYSEQYIPNPTAKVVQFAADDRVWNFMNTDLYKNFLPLHEDEWVENY